MQHRAPEPGAQRARADAGADAVPIAHGAKVRPAWIALKPWPSCRYSDIVSMSPIIPAKNTSATTHARGVRALAQQARLHERRAAGALTPRSCHAKAPKATSARGHRRERPRRPARLAALDQREDQQRAAPVDEDGAGHVERRRVLRARLGSRRQRADERDDADGHVDEEDRAPAQAEQVAVDQQAADDRAEHGGAADDGAEHPEGLGDLLLRERRADDPEALRDHERGEAALQQAEGDELAGRAATPQSTEARVKPAMPMRKRRRRP